MIKNILIATSYLPILEVLYTCLEDNDFVVVGVVSREKDDIIAYAKEKGFQYININNKPIAGGLGKIIPGKIDLGIAWGINYLNKSWLEIPEKGFINIHPSDLPSYRGGFPFQAQILNNEAFMKITIHKTTPVIDKGIILIKSDLIKIDENDGMSNLVKKCLLTIPNLIIKVLRNFDVYHNNPQIINWQKDDLIPDAWGKRKKDDGYKKGVLGKLEIDFKKDSIESLNRKIKAFDMVGGPYFQIGNAIFNIKSIKNMLSKESKAIGEVIDITEDEITIQCIGKQLTFQVMLNSLFSKNTPKIEKTMIVNNAIGLDDYVKKTIFS